MAVSRFFCQVCLKDFHFRSRYERHLLSGSHLRMREMLANPVQDEDTELTSNQQSTSDSGDRTCTGTLCTHMYRSTSEETDDKDMPYSDDSFQGTNSNEIVTEEDHENILHSVEHDALDFEEIFRITPDGDDYSPFQSKVHALAYMLINSPRPMGESNLSFVFFILHQLDSTLPSLSSLKTFKLPRMSSPQQHYDSKGVPFYVNSIKGILERCMGTPYIASSLARYPTIPDNSAVCEMFFGRRWREDVRYHSPMASLKVGHVFIYDFVKFLHEEKTVMGRVSQFVHKKGAPGTFAQITQLYQNGHDSFVIGDEIIVHSSDIVASVSAPLVIFQQDLSPLTPEEYKVFTSCHSLKLTAGELPVVMVPLILYSDDTSGNKSKRWNKFDSWCLKLAGLPNYENQKLENIHHICSSNKVSSIEMAAPLVEELKSLETKGFVAYDASSLKNVLVVAPVLCVLCDNPRASEVTNNLGPGSRMFCRICMADRDTSPGVVAELRSKRQTLNLMNQICSKSTQCEKSTMKTQFGIRDSPNPLLQLPIDLHRCTPVETLHTILLGPYKYLLGSLMGRISTRHKEEIQARISSLDFSGIEYKLSYNLSRHYKSYVGRDYKTLAQVALHLLTPYMTPGEKKVWLCLSKLFRITYCQPFVESSRNECKRICEEFVHTVHEHFPELKKKVKIHLILHLTENMLDFGPTSAFNTERCETFNSLIRAHNIFANRMAPSRDIAKHFSIIEHLRFICSGGSLDGSTRCGRGLTSLFSSPAVQRFLYGVSASTLQTNKHIYQPGSLRKFATTTVTLDSLQVEIRGIGMSEIKQMIKDPKYTLLLMSLPKDTVIIPAKAVIGHHQKRELIHVGKSVKFSTGSYEIDIGVLASCFEVSGENSSYCVIQMYQPLDSLGDPLINEYDCPIYELTNLFRCVPSHCINHTVSVIHECSSSCTFAKVCAESQIERETVMCNKLIFKHDFCNNLYFYNIYCMHSQLV